MTHFQGTQQGTEKKWSYTGAHSLANANSTERQGFYQWQYMTAEFSVIWDDKKFVPILWVFPKIPQLWSVHEKTSDKPRLWDSTGYLVSPDQDCHKVRINRFFMRLSQAAGDWKILSWQQHAYVNFFVFVLYFSNTRCWHWGTWHTATSCTISVTFL